MHRLPLVRRFLIIALCAAGLAACEGNVEVPTLMPTLPAAQATPVKPPASQAAPTQLPAEPAASAIVAAPLPITTPVTATQIIAQDDATLIPGLSGADLDQVLEQYQQDLNGVVMTDVTSDSLETNADQALNQLSQSLDSTDTLSDVGK